MAVSGMATTGDMQPLMKKVFMKPKKKRKYSKQAIERAMEKMHG